MKLNFTIDTMSKTEIDEAINLLATLPAKGGVAKATTPPKTTRKAPVKAKTEPEPTDAIPEPVKETEEPATEEKCIELAELKECAKAAVGKTDVDTVKKTIARYGRKLAEVTPNNYGALIADLKAL